MILVDTSVWIDHLRSGAPLLASVLEDGEVMMHPFVLGELACGRLENRAETLELLAALPAAPSASEDEALAFIERRKLMGRGLGYIDVHLLASAALGRISLWTRDKQLASVASEMKMRFMERG